MLENTYLFFKGLLSFKYEVPIPLQITAYVVFGILLTALLYIFRDNLSMSPARDKYMWYYFIAILNIINICFVLGYYYMKHGTYVGEQGLPGHKGQAGESGTELSCNLCEQNIFMVPTTVYELIAKMDFITLANKVINPDLSASLDEVSKTLANNYFDYGEFTNNLINGTFDTTSDLTNKLMLLSIYNEFPLIKHINETMGLSDTEATGYIKNPGGKTGYFRLSDMAFGGSEEYNPTAFLVNGDIRTPIGFDKVCTFVSVGNDGAVSKYNVLRMIPPETGPDKYVSLGNVITPADQTPDIMQYAVAKTKCVKKLSTAKLKLVFIYPAAAFRLSSKSATELNSDSNKGVSQGNMPISEGFFSVWRTPFSTIHVKFSNGDFIDGKSIIENLYLTGSEIPENIYTKYGTVKKVITEKVNAYLEKIRLPKVILCTMLFQYTIEIVKEQLKEYVTKYVVSGTKALMPTPALRKAVQPSTMYISDISTALKDIAEGLQANYERNLATTEANIEKASKSRLRSLYDIASPEEAKEMGIDYQMVKDYDAIKQIVNELSVKIENGKTMADLFKNIFPGGLGTKIKTDTLTATQERLLNLIACIIPPETDVYILKNECLAYEQIDEERQDIALKLEEALKKLNKLTSEINRLGDDKSGSAETLCGGKKNLEQINNAVTETYEFIARNVGHIPDYLKKLQKANFEDFTTDKLSTIHGQVLRLIELIENKCG